MTGRLARPFRRRTPSEPLSRDVVVSGYRLLLGREPESEAAIAAAMRLRSPLALLQALLESAEFKARCGARPRLMDESAPPLAVDWEVDPGTMAQLMSRVSRTWTQLGDQCPYWSVLAGPEFLPENAVGREHEFYASGANDLRMLLATLARARREPAEFPVAFEFGCGLGRVTSHLCNIFERVIACDISSSHLVHARRALRERGVGNVELRQATVADFAMSGPFDLWFNRLVLQHNPPPLIAAIVERALAMLRPQGLAVFQVPVYLSGYRFDIEQYLAATASSGPFEMHALPQPAILAIARRNNCALLEIREDDSAGDPWISQVFTFEKS